MMIDLIFLRQCCRPVYQSFVQAGFRGIAGSASVFKIKSNIFWIILSIFFSQIMKINNFQGELTDISKKGALVAGKARTSGAGA